MPSLDDCKAQCATAPFCTGVGYDEHGRCEVWLKSISASEPQSGSTCLRYTSGTPAPAPKPVSGPSPAPPAPKPVSGPSPAPPTCSVSGSDCRLTKCCTDPKMKCYEKDAYWASCRESCAPGKPNPADPPMYQTPWNCKLLDGGNGGGGTTPRPAPPRAPSPAPAPAPSGDGWTNGTR